MVASTSLARRRVRLIGAKHRSVTPPRVWTVNPTCIGVGKFHQRPARARRLQQRPGFIALLDVGCVGLELDHAAIDMPQSVPFATLESSTAPLSDVRHPPSEATSTSLRPTARRGNGSTVLSSMTDLIRRERVIGSVSILNPQTQLET